LHCLVNADGTTRDCKVIEETPANLGFGDAALGMSQEFRMKPQTLDCKPTNDGKINVPVSFPPL
jgi:protein TonB